MLEALTGVKRAHNETDQNLDDEQTNLKKQKVARGADEDNQELNAANVMDNGRL
jgi:hypothetical protein